MSGQNDMADFAVEARPRGIAGMRRALGYRGKKNQSLSPRSLTASTLNIPPRADAWVSVTAFDYQLPAADISVFLSRGQYNEFRVSSNPEPARPLENG